MKKDWDADAIVIIDNSQDNKDLLWATGFRAGDDFTFIQTKKDKIIMTNCMEIERAKIESKATKFISEQVYEEKVKVKIGKERYKKLPGYLKGIEVLDAVLKELDVHKILIQRNDLGFANGKALEKKGYELIFKGKEDLFEERMIKSEEEIGWIEEAQRANEAALRKALKVIRDSEIKNGLLLSKGKVLTSGRIRKIIELELFKRGYLAKETIVACGKDSAIPHAKGSGPLKAHQPIVMDIFPQSIETGYFADMTRTFVKGKASKKLTKMYYTVLEGQKIALGMIKEGAEGEKIHKAVEKCFTSQGFKTSISSDLPYGFFHGTGHSLGLEIHEHPVISKRRKDILKAGNVVTVEPGLYYPGFGGVRIEDLVVVTKDGCRNLTKFEKEKFEL